MSYSAMQRGCRQDLLETKGETLALLMTLLCGMAVLFVFQQWRQVTIWCIAYTVKTKTSVSFPRGLK